VCSSAVLDGVAPRTGAEVFAAAGLHGGRVRAHDDAMPVHALDAAQWHGDDAVGLRLDHEAEPPTAGEAEPHVDNGLSAAAVAALLQRIARRDEAAFTQLYKAFSRKLHAYALRQLNDAAQAEEVVSDTFHEVWLHPERFRGDSRFGTFLIGIARYKALMCLRSGRAEPHTDDVDDLAEVLASSGASAFEAIAGRQRERHVRDCMARLSTEQRECVHLVFFEGLSLGEVARLQGCPEGTVKTRMFHARQKLRHGLSLMLQAEGDDHRDTNATASATGCATGD
jgi:RNA polymerase sigma-70 factor, ECF subfamily